MNKDFTFFKGGQIMKYMRLLFIGLLLSEMIAIVHCDRNNSRTNLSPKNYLPDKIDLIGLITVSDVRTFTGESLFEYINGGAEIYHLYNFVDVATVDYKVDKTEIAADIYRFDSSISAYGLYTMFRPDNPEFAQLGIEGFKSEISLDFVKGNYMVRLISYDNSDNAATSILSLAKELNKIIPGTISQPEMFSFFPPENKIEFTDRYQTESFLGQIYLTNVYSQLYILDNDTLTLFMTEDETGEKFQQWSKLADLTDVTKSSIQDISYDNENVLLSDDSYYGRFIAGLKKGNLLGIINYNENNKPFLIDWLNSLN